MKRDHAVRTAGCALLCNLGLAVPVNVLAAEGGGDTLEEVTVEGKFLATGASSATKLDVAVLDTPFSVASYTDAFMNAIETSNVGDLYKYMTGIQRAGQTAYDMSIRGFKTGVDDRNAIMVDGLPGLTGRIGSPPTIGAERIEVVRGPASVLYGQAQPGGFVNIITKKPQAKARQEFGAKITSFAGDKLDLGDSNAYAVSADLTGPFDAARRVLYRLVAEKTEDLGAFRDQAFNESLYAAPSITWNFTDATAATVGAEYRKTRTFYDRGLVLPNKDIALVAPITTTYQEPGDFQEEEGTAITFDLTHRFDNDAKFRINARRASNEDKARGYVQTAIRPDQRTLGRRAVGLNNDRTYTYFDANLVVPFDTGSIEHQAVIGINGGREDARTWRTQFFTGPATGPTSLDIDIYNPVYNRVPPRDALPAFNNAAGTLVRTTISDSYGAYASNLMTLSEHWKMNLGVRWTHEEQSIENTAPSISSREKTASKALPLAGLLYQPSRDWTYYASYSTSYVPVPSNAQDAAGENHFKPESASQIEIGAKTELMDGMVQATLALFRIDKENVLNSFACPRGTCNLQVGGERSEGAEFEINARPTDNWQFTLGLAHTDGRVVDSLDPVTLGAQLQNAAENSANLWSRYDFAGGLLDGFGIGVGLSYISERAGNIPTSADSRVIRVPEYTVVDLGFYYSLRHVDLTLKISNLTDERYFESSGSLGDLQMLAGQPRNVALTLRTHF